MKKKLLKRATKSIIVATAMGLFSLLSVFSATVAWFMSNLSTPVSGMEVKVKIIDVDFNTMTVHRCNLSASNSTVLQFYSEPSVTITNTGSMETISAGIDMDNYSDLNQTQPVLLLFTLRENTYEDDVVISATSDNENFVYQITAENITEFPFSSAVRFKSASYSTAEFPFNNVAISDLTTNTSFVTIGNGSATYNYSIEPFHGTRHTVVKYVAIVLDYYSEAIQYIFSRNIGFETLAADNNNAIDFYCDWTLEI